MTSHSCALYYFKIWDASAPNFLSNKIIFIFMPIKSLLTFYPDGSHIAGFIPTSQIKNCHRGEFLPNLATSFLAKELHEGRPRNGREFSLMGFHDYSCSGVPILGPILMDVWAVSQGPSECGCRLESNIMPIQVGCSYKLVSFVWFFKGVTCYSCVEGECYMDCVYLVRMIFLCSRQIHFKLLVERFPIR